MASVFLNGQEGGMGSYDDDVAAAQAVDAGYGAAGVRPPNATVYPASVSPVAGVPPGGPVKYAWENYLQRCRAMGAGLCNPKLRCGVLQFCC
jgi:hypothetical protein